MRVIPAHAPPHKRDRELTAPLVRAALVRRFCELEAFLEADERELRRGGTSYTLDTVRDSKLESYFP